jgi:aconitase A
MAEVPLPYARKLEEGARTLRVDAGAVHFDARVRIDTPKEWRYHRHGGILHYVLRQLRGSP